MPVLNAINDTTVSGLDELREHICVLYLKSGKIWKKAKAIGTLSRAYTSAKAHQSPWIIIKQTFG